MKPKELGVLSGSDYYIYTPSTQAKKLFLYPMMTGMFRYAPGYCLRRTSLDSFLIMYIRKGQCAIDLGSRHYQACEQQIVMLDCYAPHSYYTHEGWEAEWLHFDGVCARGYYEAVMNSRGPVITLKNTYRFEKYLHKIYLAFKDGSSVKEPLLNNYIVNLLTELLVSRDAEDPNMISAGIISDSISYINDHLTEELSLNELAARVSLSPFYFSRLFKKETGFSPHNYIITTRISNARFLLMSTDDSIKEICYSSGFTSESGFCTTFKKMTGITPSEYRDLVQERY